MLSEAPSSLLCVTQNISELDPEEQIVGFYLYDQFKELIGQVNGLLVQSGTYLPRYLTITLGGFLMTQGKIILLPREKYEVVDLGEVKTHYQIEWLQGVPSADNIDRVTAAEEERILSHYNLTPYWAVDVQEKPREKS